MQCRYLVLLGISLFQSFHIKYQTMGDRSRTRSQSRLLQCKGHANRKEQRDREIISSVCGSSFLHGVGWEGPLKMKVKLQQRMVNSPILLERAMM